MISWATLTCVPSCTAAPLLEDPLPVVNDLLGHLDDAPQSAVGRWQVLKSKSKQYSDPGPLDNVCISEGIYLKLTSPQTTIRYIIKSKLI